MLGWGRAACCPACRSSSVMTGRRAAPRTLRAAARSSPSCPDPCDSRANNAALCLDRPAGSLTRSAPARQAARSRRQRDLPWMARGCTGARSQPQPYTVTARRRSRAQTPARPLRPRRAWRQPPSRSAPSGAARRAPLARPRRSRRTRHRRRSPTLARRRTSRLRRRRGRMLCRLSTGARHCCCGIRPSGPPA